MTTVLLVNLAATLFMTGLIWFVQVVHYPLFAHVGDPGFSAYAAVHSARTTRVVAPPMIVESLTAVALALSPPPEIPAPWAWAGVGLVAIIWVSTALLQVPRHRAFAAGFDGDAWRALVWSNWLRTVTWTARAVLVSAMVARVVAG
ncbi:MAG: hypothetical protein H0U40_02125 [Chloroflexia bacterium]|nr:hypothetical protein [Chloroflexia bacterium]MDQ3512870.1 hypothetical protein [Chloroflexota bacterium]